MEYSQIEPDAACPCRQKEQEQVLRRGLVETVHERLPQVGRRTAVQPQETPVVTLGEAAKNVQGGRKVRRNDHLPRVVAGERARGCWSASEDTAEAGGGG